MSELSTRELQVLGCIADGLSKQQIAAELHVSLSTVATFKEHLYEKLGAHNGAQAVAIAYRRGILAADPGLVEAADLMRRAGALGYRLSITPLEVDA